MATQLAVANDETRTLTPFAVYCLVVGVACIVRFA